MPQSHRDTERYEKSGFPDNLFSSLPLWLRVSVAMSSANRSAMASFGATARRGPAEAFQAPARDNLAGRPASAQGNRAGVGQAAQVAGPGNPAPGE